MAIETEEEAEAEARRRFAERAEEFRENLEEAFLEVLPGNQSVADTVLLAHLMTAKDGYNDVEFVSEWKRRPQSGWRTTLSYLVPVDRQVLAPFALEARYDDHARQLAVVVDHDRPGERLPAKRARETELIARGWRVMSFTELEILSNPEACRERVEDVLFDMVEQVLTDAGILHGRGD